MPYKSDAQRRFFHTDTAKKAGITAGDVEEFDKASKGKKLPEKVQHKAEGGEVTPSGFPEPQSTDQKGLQTPPEVSAILAAMLGTPGNTDLGLGESGEISLGGNAPEMEGLASKIQPFSKGIMGKGTPNEMTIWGVKGDPEAIAKLGYGPDPASIPENILQQHGILPTDKASFPTMNAPNSYAFGGETNPKKETISAMENNPTAGFAKGGEVNSYADGGNVTSAALQALGQTFGLPAQNPISSGISAALPGATSAAQAVGSTVNPSTMTPEVLNAVMGTNVQPPTPPPVDPASIIPHSELNNPTQPNYYQPPKPATPSLGQTAQALNNTEPTNYDFYKNMSAEDRLALAQKLQQQSRSPGMLAAQALGGIGDALAAKGGMRTNALETIRGNQQQNAGNQLGAFDTARQQMMQDVQAKMSMQAADPSSPYSQGFRSFLQSQGVKVPSGMSAAMLQPMFADIAKLYGEKLSAATAAGAQGVEAGKALMGETVWDSFKQAVGMKGPEAGTNYLENRVGGTNTPASNGGWSVVR